MDLGLTDRVVLVAASSKGLGLACAEEFAAEGAHVILCARGADALATAAKAVEAAGPGEVLSVPTDLADAASIDALTTETLQRFGHVDVLVNNAGGPPPGKFEEHSTEAWGAAVRLNLESALQLARAVLPGMKERRWGRIVNVTSVAVKEPVDGLILSNSVRAAVTGWARTLANEVGEFGITVNNAMPGFTRTERLDQLAQSQSAARGLSREEIEKEWEAVIPAARLGEPREFAALVAFLGSDRASYINGVSIAVDGGRTRTLL